MGAQEGLLHQVLGVVGVAGHSIRGPEQGPQVGQHLRLETLVAVHARSGRHLPTLRIAARPPVIPEAPILTDWACGTATAAPAPAPGSGLESGRLREDSMERRRARLALALALASLLADAPLQSAETKDRLLVDASAVGTEISPWIYGQFIEHLGRCIYGGLWAEMLEDRKFFYPVTGEAPAWEMYRPGPRSWDGEGHPYELLVRSPWLVLGEQVRRQHGERRGLRRRAQPAAHAAGRRAQAGSRAGAARARAPDASTWAGSCCGARQAPGPSR